MKTRLLHPEFFTDAKVCALSAYARVLLVGLWLRCDDHGRAHYLPKQIEGEVFPREQVAIDELLGEIRKAGLIRVYKVDGQAYFVVPSWEKWQKPKYKADSKIPPPPTRKASQIGETFGQSGKTFGQDGETLSQPGPKESNRFRSRLELESISGSKDQDSDGPPKWPLVLAESEKNREAG